MCIGTSVVEEVQDVVPMVDQRVCHRLEVLIAGFLYFVYPFHEFFAQQNTRGQWSRIHLSCYGRMGRRKRYRAEVYPTRKPIPERICRALQQELPRVSLRCLLFYAHQRGECPVTSLGMDL